MPNQYSFIIMIHNSAAGIRNRNPMHAPNKRLLRAYCSLEMWANWMLKYPAINGLNGKVTKCRNGMNAEMLINPSATAMLLNINFSGDTDISQSS